MNKTKSPLLIPYPNVEVNTLATGAGGWPPRLVSVTRIRADACDRLWVMDCGTVDLLTSQPKRITSPKIVVYDLKSDKLVFSYNLRDKLDYTEESLFPTVTVDVTSANCDHAFAYLPDVVTNRLVVYSLQTNETHVITHNYFHFDPLSGDFANGAFKWQWQDGIFGLALSPVDREGYRIVYFHALASTMEFAVYSKHLQNSSAVSRDQAGDKSFKVLGTRGPGGQSSTSFLDEETGVLFFALINRHAVGCWNSFKGEDYDVKHQGVVAENEEILSFPNDIKVDKAGNLWVLNTPLPRLVFGSLDSKVVNFRLLSAPVRQAVKGTVCDEM